jgi:hypothetical protein
MGHFENDNDLGHYLAGLIEGDGHFSKKQLIISGHKNNQPLFESLVKSIGYGTIRPYSSSANAIRFVICSKAGLKRVLALINGRFVGEHKYNQLLNHNYDSRFQMVLQTSSGLSFNKFWLCGFINADGCFNITIRQCSTTKIGFRVDLRLNVSQKMIIY